MIRELNELWSEIAARPKGPLAFRFYMQPLMAMALATRDGIADARDGRPAYFWAMLGKNKAERRRLERVGWHAVSRVFFLALFLDVAYEIVVLKGIRPLQGLIIAVLLAIIPYLVVRGPANRIARRLHDFHTPTKRAV